MRIQATTAVIFAFLSACGDDSTSGGSSSSDSSSSSSGGSSAGGSSPTGGGGAPECVGAADCPNTGSDCLSPACVAETCEVEPAPLGTSCAEGGGVVCDGTGVCTASHCMDGIVDADESDVDCGGADCAKCELGAACDANSDCIAGSVCVAGGCEHPKDCDELLTVSPSAATGSYTIDLDRSTGAQLPFDAYCDMTTDGGGWTAVYKLSTDTTSDPLALWSSTVPVLDPQCNDPAKGTVNCVNRIVTSSFNTNGSTWHDVRVHLYTSSVLQKFLKFDATGKNRNAWFTKSLLLGSSWSTLTTNATTNFFLIDGDTALDRVWFINNEYNGCLGDRGWLVVSRNKATAKACAWENAHGLTNQILYPNGDVPYFWADGAPTPNTIQEADTMMVFVRP